jgi:hypothetical protein
MKEVPSFIKWIQEFFYQLQTRGKEGGRVFTKVFLIHNYKIYDIAEILREEFRELKLFLKAQPVQHHDTTTIGWFVKLHPEVHIDIYYTFLHNKVKLQVTKLLFALVIKAIFNGEKQQ